MVEPEPVVLFFGPQRLAGRISNYEDVTYAMIEITQYNFGPPVTEYKLERGFPWLLVHDAWSSHGYPIVWY